MLDTSSCLLTKKHRHWPGSLVRLAWCGIPRVPAPPLVTALHMTQWHTFPVLSCSRRPYPRTHTHTVIALLVSCFSAESQHTFAEAQIYEEASQRNWVCRLVNGTIHNAVKCCLKRKWWRRTRMCDVFLSHASFICFSRFNFSNSTNEATFFFFFFNFLLNSMTFAELKYFSSGKLLEYVTSLFFPFIC